MNKLFYFFLLFSLFINAQKTTFGIKAGYNIIVDNTTTLDQINSNLKDKASPNVSFLGGLFLNVETATGFFIQPEIYFNQFRNDYEIENQSFSIINKRIDIPFLFGKKLSFIRLYAGPVFSTYLDDEIGNTTISDLKNEEFILGLQYGIGIDLNRLSLDARYDQALSQRNIAFSIDSTQLEVNNNRPGYIQLSLGYSLF